MVAHGLSSSIPKLTTEYVPSLSSSGEVEATSMESQKAMHSQYVLQLLQLQRRTGFLCDITIYVRERAFKAHKPLLAACSLYFRSIFADTENNHTDALNLASLTPHGFEILLDYIYSGSLAITYDNSKEVLSAATCLQMTNVVETCVNFIRSSFTKAPLVNPSPKTAAVCPITMTVSPTKQVQPVPVVSSMISNNPVVSLVPPLPPNHHTRLPLNRKNLQQESLNNNRGMTYPMLNSIGHDLKDSRLSTEELNRLMPFLIAKNARQVGCAHPLLNYCLNNELRLQYRRPTLDEVNQLLQRDLKNRQNVSYPDPTKSVTNEPTLHSLDRNMIAPGYTEKAIDTQTTARSGACNNSVTPEQTSGLTASNAEYNATEKPLYMAKDDGCLVIDSDDESVVEREQSSGWNAGRSANNHDDLSGTPSTTVSNNANCSTSSITFADCPNMNTASSPQKAESANSDSEVMNMMHSMPNDCLNTSRSNSMSCISDPVDVQFERSHSDDVHAISRISITEANSAVSALYVNNSDEQNKGCELSITPEVKKTGKNRMKEGTDLTSCSDHGSDAPIICKEEPIDGEVQPLSWVDQSDPWNESEMSLNKSTPNSFTSTTSDEQALDLTTKGAEMLENANKNDDLSTKFSNDVTDNSETQAESTDASKHPDKSVSNSALNLMDVAILSAQEQMDRGFSSPPQPGFSRKPRRTTGGQTCPWPGCGRLFRHRNIYEEHQRLHELGVPVSQLRKCYMGARVKKTVRERLEEMRTSTGTVPVGEVDDAEEDFSKKQSRKAHSVKKRRTSAPVGNGYDRKRVSPKDRLETVQSFPGAQWMLQQRSQIYQRSGSVNGMQNYIPHQGWPQAMMIQQTNTPDSALLGRFCENSTTTVNSAQQYGVSMATGVSSSLPRNTSAVTATLAALGIQLPKRVGPHDQRLDIRRPESIPTELSEATTTNGNLNLDQLRRRIALRESSASVSTLHPEVNPVGIFPHHKLAIGNMLATTNGGTLHKHHPAHDSVSRVTSVANI